MAKEINSTQDIIDTREIIDRIEYLESDEVDLTDAIADIEAGIHEDELARDESDDEEEIERLEHHIEDLKFDLTQAISDHDDWLEDYGKELGYLKKAIDDVGIEAPYGVALIREDYFEEYCEEMLKDIGDLPCDLPWYIVINWEATANHLRADYAEVEIDEEIYLYRM